MKIFYLLDNKKYTNIELTVMLYMLFNFDHKYKCKYKYRYSIGHQKHLQFGISYASANDTTPLIAEKYTKFS